MALPPSPGYGETGQLTIEVQQRPPSQESSGATGPPSSRGADYGGTGPPSQRYGETSRVADLERQAAIAPVL